jgi:AcrR family transcriptional regulator
MVRWAPNAKSRLAQAAMQLYQERGFEQATVAEIAKRAGLTERTFFRHFADKREVLFGGSDELRDTLVSTLEATPSDVLPLEAVARALEAVGDLFARRRDYSRQRQAVIAGNVDLRERELIKLATLGAALTDTLRRRGVKASLANLTAEVGIAVFKTAFDRWVDDTNRRTLTRIIRDCFDELRVAAVS